MNLRSTTGFTVVELITVILLLGILSIGTVRFLGDASSGFQSAAERGEISASARQSIQHLAYMIRDALPNSIRVSASGDCLELVPIVNGTIYETAPIGSSSTSMLAVPFDRVTAAATWRTAIAPTASLYGLSNPGAISPATTVSGPDAFNQVTLTFASAHRFGAASPRRRLFAVTDPVSYCSSGGRLYRYRDYGFSASQPSTATLPATLPNRQILIGGLSSALPVFSATSATLTRNAIVEIDLEFVSGDAILPISHAVQVRNQL